MVETLRDGSFDGARGVLRVEALTAGYDDTIVLENVSFVLAADSGIALLGRNGVGKTTLLISIMGHTRIRTGHIFLNGNDITELSIHERAPRGVALVPQEREIFPSLTVHENLVVAAQPGQWTIARVFDLFPRLAERRRNYGNQLSGGEQQMLAIGRALVGNPQVMLLDEPFEGLAPVIVDNLLAALRRIRDETRMAMILIEQHAELVLELLPEAIVLDRGQVRWSGQGEALLRNPEQLRELIGLEGSN
ncbi:MAG: ABC transporter ATP-binding protein [Chthoniobacterales bacterium]